MKNLEHVKELNEALNWLYNRDYLVLEEGDKRSDPTNYYYYVRKFNLAEYYNYIILASDKVLMLTTNNAEDVVEFVNSMIDYDNEFYPDEEEEEEE